MTLKTQIESDLPVFFDTDGFADSILYTSVSDVIIPYNIDAIITRENPFQEEYVRGTEFAICEIEVLRSEFSNKLQQGDTFTIESEVWGFDPVQGIIKEDDNVFTIRLERYL